MAVDLRSERLGAHGTYKRQVRIYKPRPTASQVMTDQHTEDSGDGWPTVGILEWFEVDERDRARRVFDQMERLGVDRLRTGISWADWHVEGGREWYAWLVEAIDDRDIELLPCFTFTPPSMGEEEKSSAPPRRLRDFADFIDQFVGLHGDYFEMVELWNEPNNRSEWDFRLDPDYEKFAEMIIDAAYWAGQLDKRVVLGGLSPIDPNWLYNLAEHGAVEYLDVVGVHGFPGTWESQWDGWHREIKRIERVLEQVGSDADIWITEVGYSTWNCDEFNQLRLLDEVLDAPADRVYWYSMHDLAPERPAYDGFHLDEREYHFGLIDERGHPKLAYRIWRHHGLAGVRRMARRGRSVGSPEIHLEETTRRRSLITGGAGFVGANLARRLVDEGDQVVVYDNLSRPGVEHNVESLLDDVGRELDLVPADLRDRQTLGQVVERVDRVFHLGGQTAVTSSLRDPRRDFAVNAEGTVNLLEKLRERSSPPPVVYASTNKVYGGLSDLELVEQETRYVPADPGVRESGIDESRPLEFESPYGCSKGAGDQYVLDYASRFDVPGVVFRMSCIFGPRQRGSEDQGWIAHFIDSAVGGGQLTVFGDGKQVRDALFVDDLVEAMLLAVDRVDDTAGRVFNIGGGPERTLSLLELLTAIEQLHGEHPDVEYADWRPADQRYYVSDATRFREATGWTPEVGLEDGIERLYDWVCEQHTRGPGEMVADQIGG